jgi:hypothetical protein
MKIKLLLLCATAAAGVFASMAVASPPTGKGNPHDTTTGVTTGITTTTAHGKKKGKVLVCHKLPNGHYVLVSVNGNSSLAKLKHLGDVLAGAGGTCPGPIQNQHTGTGTGANETTTVNTTTSTSTSTSTETETDSGD